MQILQLSPWRIKYLINKEEVITMKKAFISLLMLGLMFSTGLHNVQAANKNCDDFATWKEAQQYFESHGGSPTNNVDGLDRDHDGMACDSKKDAPKDWSWEKAHPEGTQNGQKDETNQGGTQQGGQAEDKDCGDFATQEEAQQYFESHGGSSTNNVNGLDRDHDGMACEDEEDTSDENGTQGGQEDGTDQGDTNEGNTQQGGQMPDTATNYVNGILAGVITMMAGTLFYFRKKRTDN